MPHISSDVLGSLLDRSREQLLGASLGAGDEFDRSTASVGSVGHPGSHAVTSTTRFKWGSFTKVATAFLICQLAERGQLRLDDPVSRFIPQFGKRLPDAKSATIRMLLSHTAGIVDLFERIETLDELVGRLADERMIAGPGSLFSYSNAGYGLLGEIISHVSDEPWRACLWSSLVDPLELATVNLDDAPGVIGDAADDYRLVDGVAKPAPLWPDTGMVLEAAGTKVSSGIDDLLVMALTLLNGRDPRAPLRPPLLGQEMLREMQRPQAYLPENGVFAKAWGLGWSVDPDLGTVAHMGGTSAFVLGIPARGVAGAFLSNVPNTAPIGQSALRSVLELPAQIEPKTFHSESAGGLNSLKGRFTSPLFAIEISVQSGAVLASVETAIPGQSPEQIPLRRIGERTFIGTLMGAESVKTEFAFLGDPMRPTHLTVALRTLRRE